MKSEPDPCALQVPDPRPSHQLPQAPPGRLGSLKQPQPALRFSSPAALGLGSLSAFGALASEPGPGYTHGVASTPLSQGYVAARPSLMQSRTDAQLPGQGDSVGPPSQGFSAASSSLSQGHSAAHPPLSQGRSAGRHFSQLQPSLNGQQWPVLPVHAASKITESLTGGLVRHTLLHGIPQDV